MVWEELEPVADMVLSQDLKLGLGASQPSIIIA